MGKRRRHEVPEWIRHCFPRDKDAGRARKWSRVILVRVYLVRVLCRLFNMNAAAAEKLEAVEKREKKREHDYVESLITDVARSSCLNFTQ